MTVIMKKPSLQPKPASRKELTHERIVEVAARAIRRSGYDGTGVADIMKTSIALVTGASSGIGEATAKRLARAGYTVYGTSRHGTQGGERPVQMLPLDVTDEESVEAAVNEVLRLHGRIDLLVNHAGSGLRPNRTDQGKGRHQDPLEGAIASTPHQSTQ
ncbi:SDR family NAD(P)-dependent oxidoreductase [Paraburkholderia bryophila]|uniref:SDR family NAD(P)-dependent oxidoreductase n=1 Tax=Paraburkholderia bryophila TaxID=420952 RepID=UPI0007C7D018